MTQDRPFRLFRPAPSSAPTAALHPVLAVGVIVLVVALQQVPLLALRGVWWADEARHAAVLDALRAGGHWLALELNGRFYPDKPPVWFWLAGLIAGATGWDSPRVLFAALALSVLAYALALWVLARRLGADVRLALFAVLVALSGSYFVIASHYARMDFLFSALIFLAWAAFFRAAGPVADRRATLAGFAFSAAALMVKGPFGLALPLAAFVLHLALHGRLARLADRAVWAGLGLVAGVVGLWAAGLVQAVGLDALVGLLRSQIADRAVGASGTASHPLRYLAGLPLLVLPWTAVLLAPARPVMNPVLNTVPCPATVGPDEAMRFLLIATLAGLAILSAVGEKHEYYMLPILGPVSVLIAASLLRLDDARRARVALGIAALLVAAGLALLAVGAAPERFGLPIHLAAVPASLRPAAVVLLAGGLAVALARRRGAGTLIALVVAVQTVFAGLGLRAAAPRIDRFLDPGIVAAPMRPLVAAGYAPVVVHGTDGVFTHALGARYVHLRDGSRLAGWLANAGPAVIAVEAPAWARLRVDDVNAFALVGCPSMLGISFVIVASPPPPDSLPIRPGEPCP